MHPFRRLTLIALVTLAAVLTACTATDPRLADEPGAPTQAPTALATSAPTTAPTAPTSATPIGTAHVVLDVATANAVTVDVTDDSASLIDATTGMPGDGASVEAYKLAVTNLSPTTLRLTWVGGPCDMATQLSIDAARHRLLLVQKECPGDAIATDRMLDLEFATPILASEFEAYLQDGLDT
jgi:hypothetical protein